MLIKSDCSSNVLKNKKLDMISNQEKEIQNKPTIKLPVIDFAKCTNCKECIEICPQNAIIESENFSCSKCIKYCVSMDVPCNPEKIIFSYEHCDVCGKCISACPSNAIYLRDCLILPK